MGLFFCLKFFIFDCADGHLFSNTLSYLYFNKNREDRYRVVLHDLFCACVVFIEQCLLYFYIEEISLEY